MGDRTRRGPYKKYLDRDSNLEIPTRSANFYDETKDEGSNAMPSRASTSGNSLDKNAQSPLTQHQLESDPLETDGSINRRDSGQSSQDEDEMSEGADGTSDSSPNNDHAQYEVEEGDVAARCPRSNDGTVGEDCHSNIRRHGFDSGSSPERRVASVNPRTRVEDLNLLPRTQEGNSDNELREREFEDDLVDITIDEYISNDEAEDISEIEELSDAGVDQGDDNDEDIEGQSDNSAEQQRQILPQVARHTHLKLRTIIQSEGFMAPITTAVAASPSEALLMALSVAQVNKLTFKAFVDSTKLINSLFVSPVIPNSSYLLDSILLASEGVKRIFYCSKCFYSFGLVDHKAISELICPEPDCKHLNKIKDVTQATYFVLFSVPSQIELLLGNVKIRSKLVNPKEVVTRSKDELIRDLYDGQCYKDFVSSLPDNCEERIVSFTFCTDGSPLFKSSNYSIWPFFLSINELPPIERMRNLIIAGLWFGSKQPPMHLFLDPVVDHLKTLSDGFVIRINAEEIHFKGFCLACCVDSGARGSVQGLNSHSGYYSCNWCEIAGQHLDRKVVFPFQEDPPKLRTHQDVVRYAMECVEDGNLAYVYGVQYLTPLSKLPKFNIVDGMVQDFAHNVPFGISRTFLQDWLSNTGRGSYIGSPGDLKELDAKMSQLTPPIEVRRYPRKISDSVHWNAREYENWTLLYSLPVLEGILPLKYTRNWSYLVQAVFLLSRQPLSKDDINSAYRLVLHFISEVEYLYGTSFMSFNLHILMHLAQNVLRWGPIFAVSTYCFENGIKDLKAILHAQRGVPHQILRDLSYRQAEFILREHCSTQRTDTFDANIVPKPNKMTAFLPLEECVLVGPRKIFVANHEELHLLNHSQFNIDIPNCTMIKKIIREKCVYTTDDLKRSKFNNSVALTTSNEIITIKKFICDLTSERVFFFYVTVTCSTFLRFPQGIRISPPQHCTRRISSVGRRLHLASVQDFRIVCVKTAMNDKEYISPLPNIYNVF